MEMTKENLVKHFICDPETGLITRRYLPKNGKNGFGSKNNTGYVCISFNRKKYLAHRLIWLFVHGSFPKGMIDHINRIKTDNRISNLREVSNSENMQNIGFIKSNKSGIKGVSFKKSTGKWVANISIGGKAIFLGSHDDKESAAQAYKDAQKIYHPYSLTNEIGC